MNIDKVENDSCHKNYLIDFNKTKSDLDETYDNLAGELSDFGRKFDVIIYCHDKPGKFESILHQKFFLMKEVLISQTRGSSNISVRLIGIIYIQHI